MIGQIDRASFGMLVREGKTFLVYVNELRDDTFYEIRDLVGYKLFVLYCSPEVCPSVLEYTSEDEMPVVLFFFKGRFLDKVLIRERNAHLYVKRFADIAERMERKLMDISLYQRRRTRLMKAIRALYSKEVEDEKI